MDANRFQYWEEKRFGGEVKGCYSWSRRNDWAYKISQMLIILFSSLTTAALALGKIFPSFPGQVYAIAGSFIVTFAASSLKVFHFQEKALFYAEKYDALMQEQAQFMTADGEYIEAGNKEELFVQKVEKIISESNKRREIIYYSPKTE